MDPSNVQIPNSNFSRSFGYRYVKDHEEEEGGHVGEPGDHGGLEIFEQFFFYVA